MKPWICYARCLASGGDRAAANDAGEAESVKAAKDLMLSINN